MVECGLDDKEVAEGLSSDRSLRLTKAGLAFMKTRVCQTPGSSKEPGNYS